MPLQFALCSGCQEDHALRPDGRMSIHDNASGQRCPGPAGEPRPCAQRSRPERAQTRPEKDMDPELAAAFEYVNTHRKKDPDPDRAARGLDRRIYATGRPQITSGGLPGTGK